MRRRSPFTFALITAGAGLVVSVLVFVLVANNIGGGDGDSGEPSSADEFVVGQAAALADTVEREGPLLLPDPAGRTRDIYVQHLGGDGWRAFEARPPGTSRQCTLRWEPPSRTFTDPCTDRTYTADGAGLTTFPIRVDDRGRLLVDLRSPMPPTTVGPTTTLATPAPSSVATVTTAGA